MADMDTVAQEPRKALTSLAIDAEVWTEARVQAVRQHTTATKIVERALRHYLKAIAADPEVATHEA